MVAVDIAPPAHIVISAVVASRRSSSCRAVAICCVSWRWFAAGPLLPPSARSYVHHLRVEGVGEPGLVLVQGPAALGDQDAVGPWPYVEPQDVGSPGNGPPWPRSVCQSAAISGSVAAADSMTPRTPAVRAADSRR